LVGHNAKRKKQNEEGVHGADHGFSPRGGCTNRASFTEWNDD